MNKLNRLTEIVGSTEVGNKDMENSKSLTDGINYVLIPPKRNMYGVINNSEKMK